MKALIFLWISTKCDIKIPSLKKGKGKELGANMDLYLKFFMIEKKILVVLSLSLYKEFRPGEAGMNKVFVRDDNESMSTGSRAIDATLLFPFKNRYYSNQ